MVLVVPCGVARETFVRAIELGDAGREVVAVVGTPRVSVAGFAELVDAQEKPAGYAACERGHEAGESSAGS
eukprot:CAMPEP_0115112396 /NCGR_PEP_ID=MMETSP0227-20121206/40649_1 /TAXON_ID=89957 /ORGANISM="Polarella glacialis, Strain CCMP 1383" /LENGTH=70 /DNA_ID=CAMNT_0002512023 /DNA_START=159 /DNA_END=371 /DNA_ORIENTATION=+